MERIGGRYGTPLRFTSWDAWASCRCRRLRKGERISEEAEEGRGHETHES